MLKFISNNNRIFEEKNIFNDDGLIEDKMKILSSNAFQRLTSKSQVLPAFHGNHYKNRLTHTLEVAEVAKNIAKYLDLNEDLAEIISLVHDIGHPPFGHVGENIINDILKPYNKNFNHNDHVLKVFTKIERWSNKFSGVNLTIDVLDGMLKHNGPVINPSVYVLEYAKQYNLNLNSRASLESQIAAVSDDIAYLSHDLEDAIRSSIVCINELKKLKILSKFENFDENQIRQIRIKITKEAIDDVFRNTADRLNKFKISAPDQVVNFSENIVDFSDEFRIPLNELRKFLLDKYYHSQLVLDYNVETCNIINNIFRKLIKNPNFMTNQIWIDEYNFCQNESDKIDVIIDYIACMTDTFAATFNDYLNNN